MRRIAAPALLLLALAAPAAAPPPPVVALSINGAIGPATAKELKENGISVDYIPKEYVVESVVEGFEKMGVRGKRILLARAQIAAP